MKTGEYRVGEAMSDDLKWLWAAYKKGVFASLIEDGLDKDGFVSEVNIVLSHLDHLFNIYDGERVIGIVGLNSILFSNGAYMNIRIIWFPWSTARQRLGGAAEALIALRDKFSLLVTLNEEEKGFATHIAKYGLLRRVGQLDQAESKTYLMEPIRQNG